MCEILLETDKPEKIYNNISANKCLRRITALLLVLGAFYGFISCISFILLSFLNLINLLGIVPSAILAVWSLKKIIVSQVSSKLIIKQKGEELHIFPETSKHFVIPLKNILRVDMSSVSSDIDAGKLIITTKLRSYKFYIYKIHEVYTNLKENVRIYINLKKRYRAKERH